MTPEVVTVPPGTPSPDVPRDGALVVDVHASTADRLAGAAIFVHGFAGGRRGGKARQLAADLPGAGWTLLCPELQGHGDSGGTFEGLTIERSIRDVLRVAALPAFRDAPRRVLMGSSFGGVVAAWAAADHADLCQRVVLIAPAFGFLDRYVAGLTSSELEHWRLGEVHVARSPAGDRALGPEILRETDQRSWRRLAERSVLPTLLIHGRDDEAVPMSAVADYVAAVASPGLQAVFLGGADHRLTRHLPVLSTLVRSFLGGGFDASEPGAS